MPASAQELGRALRRVRTRQGLRIEDVSARTGLALDQLQGLENGALDASADRMAVLRTLRRYADFLGLPGDRYVLALVDHWPAPAAPPAAAVPAPPSTGSPLVTAISSPGGLATGPSTGQLRPVDRGTAPVAIGPVGPVTATALVTQGTGTRAFPSEAASGAPSETGFGRTGTHPAAGEAARGGTGDTAGDTGRGPAGNGRWGSGRPDLDTGMTPVVTSHPPGPPHRPPTSPPLILRVTVVVVALAVVAVGAGLVIHRFEPRWLTSAGIGHSGQQSTPTKPNVAKASTSTTTAPEFIPGAGTATSKSFTVRAQAFLVEVTAVGNDSWIQATTQPASARAGSSGSSGGSGAAGTTGNAGTGSVLFAGILASGQTKDFLVQHQLTLEIGSIAAHVAVVASKKTIGHYVPTVAPFTMTFVRSAN
jgi:hypothetical protein